MPRKTLTVNLAGTGVRFPRVNADQSTDELTAAALAAALDTNPLATLGIRASSAETVRVSDFANQGESSYGASQSFSVFYSAFHTKFFIPFNTGTSAFVAWSPDGLNWSQAYLVAQSPIGMVCVAMGADSAGNLWAIATAGSGTVRTTRILKSTTAGLTWTAWAAGTAVSLVAKNGAGTAQARVPTEFSGLAQIGDGRMVSLWGSDEYALSGLFYFNTTTPATQTLDNAMVAAPVDGALFYDAAAAGGAALLAIIQGDGGSNPTRLLQRPDASGTTTLTSLAATLPSGTFGGSQWSLTRSGTNYLASFTARNSGGGLRADDEYLCVATVAAPTVWTPIKIGTAAVMNAVHPVHGSGGLAINGSAGTWLIRTFSAGFGTGFTARGDIFVTRFDLSPPVADPLLRMSDALNLRSYPLPARPLLDNQDMTLATATYALAANTRYVCRGRAVILLPTTAVEGDTVEVVKGADALVVAFGASDYITWTDGVTYNGGSSISDTSLLVRTYFFRCLSQFRWLAELPKPISADGLIVLKDIVGSGSSGGTFTAGGVWRTRQLQTIATDTTGLIAALSANRFILPAGRYRVRISCPAWQVDGHMARLYNVTAAAVAVNDHGQDMNGTTEYAGASAATTTRSMIVGRIVLAAATTFEIQHQCQTTSNGHGLGANSGFAGETYTVAEFVKE